MDGLVFSAIIALVVIVALVVIGFMLAKLYVRSQKDTAYVRTGLGGQRVILDGGALVLPVFHNVTLVNMQTLKLTVRRDRKDALITLDPLRCDVVADFFVRVKPDGDGIAKAAQTLGERTKDATQLRELIESKFIDALRAVAAGMSLRDMHEKRQEFVQQVQNVSAHDLDKNGLELEAVALTHFDQTNPEHLDQHNSFDAQGLRILAEITQAQAMERNRIDNDARVSIELKNYEAAQKSLTIARDTEYATLQQEQEISFRRAEQTAQVAKAESEARQASEEARIEADRQIKEREIASARAIEIANIQRDRDIETARIDQQRAVEAADIERRQNIDIATQTAAIAVAGKAEETAAAEASANIAKAEAVKSEELVVTNRETAKAERVRAITVIHARENAERDATAITVQAETEKRAALDRADAIRTVAEAERDKVQITAAAEAERVRLEADANAHRISSEAEAQTKAYEAETKYRRDLNEASNALSPEQVELKRITALYDRMPEIIAAQAKPMERIDSIRILHMPNAPTSSIANNDGSSPLAPMGSLSPSGGLADELVKMLAYFKIQSPILDEISRELRQDFVQAAAQSDKPDDEKAA